jgi:hypothetical protein
MNAAQITLVAAIVVAVIAVIGLLTKVVRWVFNAAVDKIIAPLVGRMDLIEDRIKLLWAMGEQRAMETLHHLEQPIFDYLIEQFQSHTMTPQELTQFTERLEAIIADPGMFEQHPSASVLLNSALAEGEARFGLPGQRAQGLAGVLKENVIAGEAMRVEAKPQREVPATIEDHNIKEHE